MLSLPPATVSLSVLAAIPSPPGNTIGVGPLQVRAYGVMIALGVLAAVWIAQRRWLARGGDPDDITAIATWAVPAGLVGARLYHVITDWYRFEGRWLHVFAIWEGGLGIPGGLVAGVLAGLWVVRRRGLPAAQLMDVAAPAIPVAQAIGRLGNWFNQELFGRPTGLPWGLRIDPEHRPAGYEHVATFHPTFLYEALWNLALAGVLVWVGRRWNPRPGQLFAGYVAGYGLGRLWVESLRIDPATHVLGVRVNILVSGAAFVGAVVVMAVRARRSPAVAAAAPVPADGGEGAPDPPDGAPGGSGTDRGAGSPDGGPGEGLPGDGVPGDGVPGAAHRAPDGGDPRPDGAAVTAGEGEPGTTPDG